MSKIINSSEPKNTIVQLQMIKHNRSIQQKIAIFGSFELFFCSFKLFLLIQTIFSFELFFCSWTIFFCSTFGLFFFAHIELFFGSYWTIFLIYKMSKKIVYIFKECYCLNYWSFELLHLVPCAKVQTTNSSYSQ